MKEYHPYKNYWTKLKELKEKLKRETSKYKKNAINTELKKLQSEKQALLIELESLQGEPSWGEEANERNSKRGLGKTSHLLARQACQRGRQAGSAWRVLRSAFLFPVLGRSLSRDLSPLKPLLVEGV